MGSIIVGQKSPKTVDMGGFTVSPSQNNISGKKQELSAEEKARIVKNIMALPKDQIVPALRKNGFTDIADITEAEMKEAEKEAQANAREKRLSEIKALPAEEQLPLLLEEGFTEEAQKLSEELAQEHADAGAGDTNQQDDATGDSAGLNENGGEEEPEKKKVGRPKKSEE